MDSVERDNMIESIRQQQAQLSAQLKQLGITDEKKKKSEKSPDGGPVSEGHTFLRPRIVPTITVKAKSSGRTIHIRKEQFDEKLHERIAVERKTRQVGAGSYEASQLTVTQTDKTRDQLLSMTVPALLKQPELDGLQETPPDKKVKIVDLILKRREEPAVTG